MRCHQQGFSLIELIVGVVIVGILIAVGAPSLSNWVQNSQLRTTAQSIQDGLQLARAQAVHRNTSVRFQLTSTLDDTCVLSTTNSNWVVSLDDTTGECGEAPSDTNDPRIIQKRSSGEGSGNAVVAAGQSNFIFNGLGRLATAAGTITVTNPTGGACASTGGPMNCMNIVVTIGGQVRMCNPAKAATDPQGC